MWETLGIQWRGDDLEFLRKVKSKTRVGIISWRPSLTLTNVISTSLNLEPFIRVVNKLNDIDNLEKDCKTNIKSTNFYYTCRQLRRKLRVSCTRKSKGEFRI